MKKTTIAILGLAVAALASSSAAQANGYAATIGAEMTADLSKCPVTAASRSCNATPVPILSSRESLTPCTAVIAYTSGGAQEGLCSFAGSGGQAGTLVANVSNIRCDSFAILGPASGTTLIFTDPSGGRWSIVTVALRAGNYQSSTQDSWTIDPTQSWMLLRSVDGRAMRLTVGGTARANSRCSVGVPASSVMLDLAMAGLA